MPSHIGSLTFEHSKHLTPNSSLSSIVLLDEVLDNETHRLLTLGLGVHMRSISTQIYNFTSLNETIQKTRPLLDFTKIPNTRYNYQYPIFQRLREELRKVFSELKEISEIEEIRKGLGITSDPWDRYLILDSKYFIKLLCQETQMSTWELVCFLEFVVYSVKNELVSMFKIDMKELREEFLKYVRESSTEIMTKMIQDPESVDPEWGLNQIDERIIKNFYVEAKMKNWMEEFKNDYDELLNHGTQSEKRKIDSETGTNEPPSLVKNFLTKVMMPPK